MDNEIVCWRCGAPLVELLLPLSRREECAQCGADQHVCKLCRFYNSQVSDQCTEERAEAVTNKEKANFCDYFSPRSNAFEEEQSDASLEAQAQLAELFGDAPPDREKKPMSEAEAARAELDRLFGGDEDG